MRLRKDQKRGYELDGDNESPTGQGISIAINRAPRSLSEEEKKKRRETAGETKTNSFCYVSGVPTHSLGHSILSVFLTPRNEPIPNRRGKERGRWNPRARTPTAPIRVHMAANPQSRLPATPDGQSGRDAIPTFACLVRVCPPFLVNRSRAGRGVTHPHPHPHAHEEKKQAPRQTPNGVQRRREQGGEKREGARETPHGTSYGALTSSQHASAKRNARK